MGAKIGPKIDFGGLWAPLCNALDCFCLDVILLSFNGRESRLFSLNLAFPPEGSSLISGNSVCLVF